MITPMLTVHCAAGQPQSMAAASTPSCGLQHRPRGRSPAIHGYLDYPRWRSCLALRDGIAGKRQMKGKTQSASLRNGKELPAGERKPAHAMLPLAF
jgi:hypothetical protein